MEQAETQEERKGEFIVTKKESSYALVVSIVAFVLLVLLLIVSIFSLVGLSIYATYVSQIWQHSTTWLRMLPAFRLVLELAILLAITALLIVYSVKCLKNKAYKEHKS